MMETIKAVRCAECGELIEADSKDYFVITGDITIGECGESIFTRYKHERMDSDPLIICNNDNSCLKKAMGIETKLVRGINNSRGVKA
jgi:hypothetical protein